MGALDFLVANMLLKRLISLDDLVYEVSVEFSFLILVTATFFFFFFVAYLT